MRSRIKIDQWEMLIEIKVEIRERIEIESNKGWEVNNKIEDITASKSKETKTISIKYTMICKQN